METRKHRAERDVGEAGTRRRTQNRMGVRFFLRVARRRDDPLRSIRSRLAGKASDARDEHDAARENARSPSA